MSKSRGYLYSGIIFLFVAFAAWIFRSNGWYATYWYADVFLHFLSGVAFGLFWIGLNNRTKHNSILIMLFGVMAFAAFGSVMWEFWEYAGWRITPGHMRAYIPELGDSLNDILCGIVGGGVSWLLFQPKNN